jgi:hypothetical protein
MQNKPPHKFAYSLLASAILVPIFASLTVAQTSCPSADADGRPDQRVIISHPGVAYRILVPKDAKYAYVIGIAGGGGGGSTQVNGADGENTTVDGVVIARGAPGASGLRLEGHAYALAAGGVGSQASPPEGSANSYPRSAESGDSVETASSPLAVARLGGTDVIPGGQTVVDPEPYRRGDGGGGGASSCGSGGNGGSVDYPAGQSPAAIAYGAGGGGGYGPLPHEGGSGGFGSVAQARLMDLTRKEAIVVRVGRGGRGAPEIPGTIGASGSGVGGYAVIMFLKGPINPQQQCGTRDSLDKCKLIELSGNTQ